MGFIKNFKESFSSAKSQFQALFLKDAGFNDLMNIYERIENPHFEMREAMFISQTNPEIATSSDLFTNAIMGGNLTVETENQRMKHYFENRFLPQLKPSLRNGIDGMVRIGNGYIEILRGVNTGKPLKFRSIANPFLMYIDFDQRFNPTRYILSTPGIQGKSYTIKYIHGKKLSIKGIEYEPKDIIQLKMGQSILPVYGRSSLCSCIAEGKILREIMNNEAIVARYKSINRKIIRFLDEDGHGIGQEELQTLAKEMEKLPLASNFVTNKSVEVQDISYSGTHQSNAENMKWFSQRMSSTLAPAFYTHGDVTNYAVAKEQKNAYYLQVEAIRDQIREPIDNLLREVGEKEFGDPEVYIKFGDFDFPTREDKTREIIEQFKTGIITLNEARKEIGLEPDEEIGDGYSFELTPAKSQELEKIAGALRNERT